MDHFEDAVPNWIELRSIKSLRQAAEITNLSEDTLARSYPSLIVRVSPRRRGMALGDVLAIARGKVPSEMKLKNAKTA